jgi:hypothetical protein
MQTTIKTTITKKVKEMTTDRISMKSNDSVASQRTVAEALTASAKAKPARRKGPAITSKLVCSGVAATITFGVAGFLGFSNQPAVANETDSLSADVETGAELGRTDNVSASASEQAAASVVVVVRRRIHVVKAAIPELVEAPALAPDSALGGKATSRDSKRRFNPKPAKSAATSSGNRTKRATKQARTLARVAPVRVATKATPRATPKPRAIPKPRAVVRKVRRAKTKAS